MRASETHLFPVAGHAESFHGSVALQSQCGNEMFVWWMLCEPWASMSHTCPMDPSKLSGTGMSGYVLMGRLGCKLLFVMFL